HFALAPSFFAAALFFAIAHLAAGDVAPYTAAAGSTTASAMTPSVLQNLDMCLPPAAGGAALRGLGGGPIGGSLPRPLDPRPENNIAGMGWPGSPICAKRPCS